MPWIRKVPASPGSEGERQRLAGARSLSLSLCICRQSYSWYFSTGLFCAPRAYFSQPGPESERGLTGRKLKALQAHTEVRFLFN